MWTSMIWKSVSGLWSLTRILPVSHYPIYIYLHQRCYNLYKLQREKLCHLLWVASFNTVEDWQNYQIDLHLYQNIFYSVWRMHIHPLLLQAFWTAEPSVDIITGVICFIILLHYTMVVYFDYPKYAQECYWNTFVFFSIEYVISDCVHCFVNLYGTDWWSFKWGTSMHKMVG